jgi:hypothetical protein
MSSIKNICCGVMGILCCCYGNLLTAQNNGNGKTNPFTIRGNVGASANFYSSNEVVYSRPSFGWNVNGNFVAKVNQVTLPFSFVINQYTNNNAYLQAGVSPTYKWAKFHVGDRYIQFSPLTFGNQTFRGIGVELNPKQFRFAAFYGRLNRAFNEDTSAGRFRLPQYSRTAYGVKIGIGSTSRFLDLIYFHAKDDSASASFVNSNTKNSIHAQENAVLGSSFKLTMVKKIIWTGEIALSGLIPDVSSNNKSPDSSNGGLKKIINNFLPGNLGTLASYGGESSLSYSSTKFNSNLGYRRVQPNFKSLGTPYLLNDVELITLNTNHTIAKGKVNLSANFSQQHNDLKKDLPAELKTQVGNLNANALLNQHLNVNINLSGYNLKQKNGNPGLPDSLRVNDSLLLNQWISQINISPSYNIAKGNKLHLISANVSLQNLKDRTPSTVPRPNSNNLSASANYTLSLINKSLSFSLNYLFSQYKQDTSSYNSNGVSLGTSAQLLKNKSLNVQGNVGYYINKFTGTRLQKSINYSANVSYNAKRHSFNLFANYIYTPPNNEIINAINKTFPYAVATKNFYGGISYNYSIY